MLHDEARELLVQGYEATHDVEGIAKAYSVSKWTVYRLAEQKRKTGSVALRTNQRGRKPVLSAENGEKAFTTYQGGTTGERFVQYLKEILLPTLRPGDIVVMDNMRSHHVKAVREILESKGMKVLYLPPYSPDLNPIEKMWSKMKAILRSWKIRSLDLLHDAIPKALACISPLDCSHWFASSAFLLVFLMIAIVHPPLPIMVLMPISTENTGPTRDTYLCVVPQPTNKVHISHVVEHHHNNGNQRGDTKGKDRFPCRLLKDSSVFHKFAS